MIKKVAAIAGTGALMLSSAAFAASTVSFSDPAPDAGIGYEWTVAMLLNPTDTAVTAEFVRHVGAKSSYEPANAAPEIGWQHTSDWVALDLPQETLLTIELNNQRGVQYTTVDAEGKVSQLTAGQGYFPGFAVYKGWDDTSTEIHSFNPLGNFWAAQLDWITAAYDQVGQHGSEAKRSAKTRLILPAGHYSINIGGVNALYCTPEQPCYNGRHGYIAKLTAEPVPAGSQ